MAGKPDESFQARYSSVVQAVPTDLPSSLHYFSACSCQVKGNKDIRQIEYSCINIFDEMANNECREFAFSFFFISSIF